MEMDSYEFVLAERQSQEQKTSLSTYHQKIQLFLQNHKNKGIIMITSGGTSVPLQQRAVRFIQNFSTGLRGSLLAEQVLQNGQSLIYFYRQNSHLPFSKAGTYSNLLLNEDQDQIQKLKAAREKLKKYKNNLLLLPFKTIYLYLNGILLLKRLLPPASTLVLCAAVSDFIPKEVSAHKIHTCQQFSLELINSPKLLGRIAEGDKHLCVSFKLQTDPDKLIQRVDFALEKYGVDLVIGNVLGDKSWVNVTYNMTRFPEHFKNGELFKGTKEGQPQAFIVRKIREAQKHKFST